MSSEVIITAALVLVQLAVCAVCLNWTLLPLRRQRDGILRAATSFAGLEQEGAYKQLPLEAARALRESYHVGRWDEALDPELALSPERLLPAGYDSRMDAAAPGVFTALGIVGTFLGLLLAFTGINFSSAATSIEPLIGGMQISFFNSLIGVCLSIAWTVASRRSRHKYELAVRQLLRRVLETAGARGITRPSHGSQVLVSLQGVTTELSRVVSSVQAVGSGVDLLQDEMRASRADQRADSKAVTDKLSDLGVKTTESTQALLDSLAPRLEQSFKALVDMPFERLTQSVEQFRQTIDELTGSHERTLHSLEASAKALDDAQAGLSLSISEAASCVQAFQATSLTLRDEVAAAGQVVASTRDAAGSMQQATAGLGAVAERHELLAGSLDRSTTHLQAVSAALLDGSTHLMASSTRLEGAVHSISEVGTDAAKASVAAMREELQTAIGQMNASLVEFANQSAAAYQRSADRVVDAVDTRTTDLTDRMSAELATLSVRLPEAAAEITRAVGQMQKRLDASVRSLNHGVTMLDTATTQTLSARLREYDELVARAVDHFSGTLSQWDGKVGDLTKAARDFRAAVSVTPAVVADTAVAPLVDVDSIAKPPMPVVAS